MAVPVPLEGPKAVVLGDNRDILAELFADEGLPKAQGGRKARRGNPLSLEVLRPLEVSDLARIDDGPAQGARKLVDVRNSHHAAAKLMAEGLSNVEIGLATGYAPAYLSMLKSDPTFAELVAFYSAQTEQTFADMMERAKQMGLSFMDSLQADLEADPTKFTVREKMEAIELFAVKFGHAKGQSGAGAGRGAPIALQVNFVPGQPVERVIEGKILENTES